MDILNNIQAQSQPDNCLSKEFYFVIPETVGGIDPDYLYFLGEPGTVVTIQYLGETYTVTINSNNLASYNFSNAKKLSIGNSALLEPDNKGIKIISDKTITCHYLYRYVHACNGTGLLPIEQLSKLHYICPFFSQGYYSGSNINIVSTSNNNIITITNLNTNNKKIYTLQNLQTLKHRNSGERANNGQLLPGPVFKIESTEKIAVFTDSLCYTWVGACNSQICQIYGHEYFDKTFILPLTQNYNNVIGYNREVLDTLQGQNLVLRTGDAFKILSVDANNTISINGTSITLGKYETYEKSSVISPTMITATYPIFVYQCKRGMGTNNVGDPSMNAVFPFNKLSKRYVVALPPLPYSAPTLDKYGNYVDTDNPQYYALIAIKQNALSSIKVNDILLNSNQLGNFITIPGTDYVSGWIKLEGSKNRLSGSSAVPYVFEASDNFIVILDGYNWYDSYLFSAGGSMCNNLIPNLPTPNPNPSATPTRTPTPTSTPTPTLTPSTSITASPTPTPTPSKSPGASPTPTPTCTPTISFTPTCTPTYTTTCTPTPSHTPPPVVCCYTLGNIIDFTIVP